jgi:cytochrome c oxidase cbb3-type subunit 3
VKKVWAILVVLLGSGLSGCDQPPSADGLPEWKPGDHHSPDDVPGGGNPGQRAPTKGAEVPQLVELTWRQQCATCHGQFGRGDGPQGPMLHARDLSDPDWQNKVTDDDIANAIRNGKDKMPRYDLPDPVMKVMVARIRQMKAGG